jgi:hypothetical protein
VVADGDDGGEGRSAVRLAEIDAASLTVDLDLAAVVRVAEPADGGRVQESEESEERGPVDLAARAGMHRDEVSASTRLGQARMGSGP